MQPLSAAEAFNPALERAKSILLPFDWRRWIKLGFVAILAELAGGTFTFPPFGGGGHAPASSGGATSPIPPQLIILIALIAAFVVCIIGLILFYIGSRMQMVFMEMAVTRDITIGPPWYRHGFHTWRWIAIKLLCLLAVFLLGAMVLTVPAINLFRTIRASGHQTPGPLLFANVLLFFLGVLFFVLLVVAISWLLRDLVLPFIVFQDANLSDSANYAMEIVRREPGPVSLYLLLKFVFALAAGIAAQLAVAVAAFAGAIPLAAIGGILWVILHHAGDFAKIVLFIALGLLGLIFIAWIIVAALCACGATLLFIQAYALYFLGGRYPLLGNLLEPPGFAYPPPPPPIPPVPSPWFPNLSEPVE